jgi:hypothetical protein
MKPLSLFTADGGRLGRRLLAWLTSTGLLVLGYVGEDTWLVVTCVFIGAEVAQKGVSAWQSRPAESQSMPARPLPDSGR